MMRLKTKKFSKMYYWKNYDNFIQSFVERNKPLLSCNENKLKRKFELFTSFIQDTLKSFAIPFWVKMVDLTVCRLWLSQRAENWLTIKRTRPAESFYLYGSLLFELILFKLIRQETTFRRERGYSSLALNMPCRMYSIIHLSEIMRLSAFQTPLFYPSSYSRLLHGHGASNVKLRLSGMLYITTIYAKVGCPHASSANHKSLHAVHTVCILQEGAGVQCRTYIIIAKRRIQPGRINGVDRSHLPGNNTWATGLVSFLAFLTQDISTLMETTPEWWTTVNDSRRSCSALFRIFPKLIFSRGFLCRYCN